MSVIGKLLGSSIGAPVVKAGTKYIEEHGLTSRAIEKTKQVSLIVASTWRPAIATALGKTVVFCVGFTAFMILFCLIAITFGAQWVHFKADSPLLGLWLRWEAMTGQFFEFALWFLGGYATLREVGKGRDSFASKVVRRLSGGEVERKQMEQRSSTMQGIPGVSYEMPEAIDRKRLKAEIYAEESEVLHIYKDHLGHRTAGIGHLLKLDDPEFEYPLGTPITEARSREWFDKDIETAISDARSLVSGFDELPQEAMLVLANMSFQLGRKGLSKFVNMIGHIEHRQWSAAANEALDSKWARQTPARARRMAKRLRDLDNNPINIELS